MAYWKRTGAQTFMPTEHVEGSWDLEDQHIAPTLGLLAHEIERDRDRRRDDALVVQRLSYDILGTLPLEEVHVAVEVLRPGRTIELVQATATHGGRAAVLLRAWLGQPRDTGDLAGSELPAMPRPDDLEPWQMSELWPGGFIGSVEIRREDRGPGRARTWVRTAHGLVEGEEVTRLAAAAGLFDIGNGLAVRADPQRVMFPNLDLTAHLFRTPVAGWLGFDTSVSFGPAGVGLTSTVLHDEQGPIGTMAQSLTVRPWPAP
ncbi:thioesterase family protein [Nocardioides caeni]|uniref:Thioesterase family protein n=1 Tax=Nocardioides caeni TaxID=574700 RepID=A0A4S8NM75_9ACTN|nr:thioesterase family protein [Nocardioides caeni]THV18093.1 thioesterase family protein [Nocardioides caeni]